MLTLPRFGGRGAPLRGAEFTPDGKKVITADEEGIIGRFFADQDDLLHHARSIRLRDLTAHERREYAELLGR